jgi:prepilin-type N-terminal cleavage/methylation domain-containing protein
MTGAGARRGFALVELLVALAILGVGLLGVVGTLLAARRALTSSEHLHVATQTAAGIADSLLAVRAPGAGMLATEWGRIRWSAEPDGIGVRAEDGDGAPLLEWWIPAESPAP